MSSLSSPSVLLTVRGTLDAPEPEAARELHNQTAGSDEGVAAARSLGDLSHSVFSPVLGMPGTRSERAALPRRLEGRAGHRHVLLRRAGPDGGAGVVRRRDVYRVDAGGRIVRIRAARTDASHRQIPRRRTGADRRPADGDRPVFRSTLEPTISDARKAGQTLHQLYIKIPMPDDHGPAEAIGLDGLRADPAGMGGVLPDAHRVRERLHRRPPQTSVWQRATGGTWTEW